MNRRFEWDVAKAIANFEKHGVSFEEASASFQDPLAIVVWDTGHSMVEPRWIHVAMSNGGRLITSVFTIREGENGSEKIRIISARQASRSERRL